jgi:hypothetical protein
MCAIAFRIVHRTRRRLAWVLRGMGETRRGPVVSLHRTHFPVPAVSRQWAQRMAGPYPNAPLGSGGGSQAQAIRGAFGALDPISRSAPLPTAKNSFPLRVRVPVMSRLVHVTHVTCPPVELARDSHVLPVEHLPSSRRSVNASTRERDPRVPRRRRGSPNAPSSPAPLSDARRSTRRVATRVGRRVCIRIRRRLGTRLKNLRPPA